jgi:hypothetical protein
MARKQNFCPYFAILKYLKKKESEISSPNLGYRRHEFDSHQTNWEKAMNNDRIILVSSLTDPLDINILMFTFQNLWDRNEYESDTLISYAGEDNCEELFLDINKYDEDVLKLMKYYKEADGENKLRSDIWVYDTLDGKHSTDPRIETKSEDVLKYYDIDPRIYDVYTLHRWASKICEEESSK